MAAGHDVVERVDRLIKEDAESPRKVLVIGDGMTDVYVYGRMEPTCQEGCPKFVEVNRHSFPGGAANAARSLTHWRVRVNYLGLTNDGPVKTRFVEDGRIILRHDRDDYEAQQTYTMPLLRDDALQALRNQGLPPSAVLLSDYDKGLLTKPFVDEIVEYCVTHSIPCVADCKRPPEFYPSCVLKCNSEYQRRHNDSLSRLVYDSKRPQQLVITAGKLNPIIWDRDGSWGLDYDLRSVECVNHVGAGDCFAAHLTLGLAYGFSLLDATRLAHSAGRVYVQHPHNRPPLPREIRDDMAGV